MFKKKNTHTYTQRASSGLNYSQVYNTLFTEWLDKPDS